MKKYGDVMVFAEQENGIIHQVTYELLGKGRELANKMGTDLSSVLLGYDLDGKAEVLIYYGADKVFLYDHQSLEEFDIIRYKQNMVNLIMEEDKPEILLIGATRIGRTLGPRLAAALGTGLTADCVELDVDDEGNLIQIRPAFSGNIMAQIKTKTRPQMATVRYKMMKKMSRDPYRKGEVIKKEVEVIEDTGVRIIEKVESEEFDITEAKVIISGGNGLRRPEDFRMLEELASILEGVIGSSRLLVDAGWISKEHQVGFSGNTVKPILYIACGISGAPQHLFGMRDSDIIISINKDPSAPIFNISDYGIIGDLYEIIPLLTQEIKEYKERALNEG